MLAEEIATRLQTEGIGTVAVDLFIGRLPLNQNNSVAIIHGPSPRPNPAIDLHEQIIEFQSRFASTIDGFNKLKEIETLFHRKVSFDLGDFHIYLANDMGEIEDFEVDSENRKIFRLLMRFIYRPVV